DAERLELANQPRVDLGVGAGRGRAGEHADLRSLAQVEKLLDEAVDLLGRDLGAALVELGPLARGWIDHGDVGARVALDSGEVVEDRLLGQTLEDAGARGASGEAGGDHRAAEQLERAGDVHALAARDGPRLDGSVPEPEPEARYRHRPVDGGVQC